MHWLIVYICITITYAEILYQCNFDTATISNNCLNGEGSYGLGIEEKMGNVGSESPTAPLSDVTSSLKVTNNGESCQLPYKVNLFTWDMYFCNNGYCQTSTSINSICTSGKFGEFSFTAPRLVTFVLNTSSDGINGINQQCLIYYYYLSNIDGTQQNIRVRKQEPGSSSDIIDFVTNSSFNGWVKREVSFSTAKSGYKVYFDFEKISGVTFPISTIAIDEISIRPGNCFDEYTTESALSMSITTSEVTATVSHSNPIETSTEQTTIDDNLHYVSSPMTTMELTTTTTTTTVITTATTTLNIALTELSTFSSMTSLSNTLTSNSTLNNPNTESNNTYIIVLATVIPVILIGTIGVIIWIKKCSVNKKIAPSTFELNQVPPSSQT